MLTAEQGLAVLKEILSGDGSFMGCEAENVTLNASLRDDLGLDSLDHAELAIVLEEELGVEMIDYDDMDKAFTVADLVKVICRMKVVNPIAMKQTLAKIEKLQTAAKALEKKVASEKANKTKVGA